MDRLTLIGDVLKYISVDNVFFRYSDGSTCVIAPVKISWRAWLVSSSRPLEQSGILCVQCIDSLYELPVAAESAGEEGYGSCAWTVVFRSRLPVSLAQAIARYEKVISADSRRSEERFDVGTAFWQQFGLLRPDQKFFFEGSFYRFIINNASMHGALITGEKSPCREKDVIQLCFVFKKLTMYIYQQSLIVRRQQMTETLFRYSLSFIEPVSIYWKSAVERFALLRSVEKKDAIS
jgi:hypothetical protein